MAHFDPDEAIFGALAAELNEKPEETTFSYVNQAAREQFGGDLKGKKILDVLEEILGSADLAKSFFGKLLSEGSIIIEGKLNGRDAQYHSIVDSEEGHLQAAIMDTTESRRSQEGFEYTAGALARAAEANDEDTGYHIIRINHYSGELAELLGLDRQFIDNIYLLAQLHDVGKIHVDQSILGKPGKLTHDEFEEMKKHTIYGARIIGKHPRLSLARQIALGHHEKWDGTGYPYGLSGEMIPLSARIVAVADVFDALVSRRPYKAAFSYEKAYNIMSKGDEGSNPSNHFAPGVLKTFMNNYEIFTQMHSDLRG